MGFLSRLFGKRDQPQEDSPGVGLRRMTLTTPPTGLSFKSDGEFPAVYGVLTDWE